MTPNAIHHLHHKTPLGLSPDCDSMDPGSSRPASARDPDEGTESERFNIFQEPPPQPTHSKGLPSEVS